MPDMEKAEARIGTPPFKIAGEPPRACFEVSTSAQRRLDDERVVWEIGSLIDVRSDPVDWHILWGASDY